MLSQVLVWGFADEFRAFQSGAGGLPHTHSWIHFGFARGFWRLGVPAQWCSDRPENKRRCTPGTLVIACNQAWTYLPATADCVYVLHNIGRDQATEIERVGSRRFGLQVLCTNQPSGWQRGPAWIGWDGTTIFLPWASPLFADEFHPPVAPETNVMHWVGSVWGGDQGNAVEIHAAVQLLQARGIRWSQHHVPDTEEICLVRRSRLGMAITGRWQKAVGYVPCRAFKAAAYGQTPVTNNRATADLLGPGAVYHEDLAELLDTALAMPVAERLHRAALVQAVVGKHHTFLNRAKTIWDIVHHELRA